MAMELRSLAVLIFGVVLLLVGRGDGAAVMSIDFGSEWMKVSII